MKAQLPDRNRFSALSCSPAAMMPEVTREYQKSVTSRAAASLYTGLIFPSSPCTTISQPFCFSMDLKSQGASDTSKAVKSLPSPPSLTSRSAHRS